MPKYYSILFLILSHLLSLDAQDLVQYVNPFIGTGGHGHTFPGPTMPFGKVQLGPDTRLTGWDGCSGYHDSDSLVYGFSHTHLSGTGIPDYGDVLMMPGNSTLTSSFPVQTDIPFAFNKNQEIAKAGYYSCFLNKPKIKVELTCSDRVGFHKYSFNKSNEEVWIFIDLLHRDKIIDARCDFIHSKLITGKRISNAWAKEQHIYFAIQFDQPIKRLVYSKDSLQLYCVFKNPGKRPIQSKVAISAVDVNGAQLNLLEIPHWNFNIVLKQNQAKWNDLLGRILIRDDAEHERKTIFYTALYHTLIAPNLFQDRDGRFRGMDNMIHKNESHTRYTVFSLWDTYRATHPLYQLIYPEYNKEFIHTFLQMSKEHGRLPVWELAANETNCMIGNHAISVLADYLVKTKNSELRGSFDTAIQSTLKHDTREWDLYASRQYLPSDITGESVSRTLEYAYNFWCMYQITNRKSDLEKSYFCLNLFNPKSGFFQARRNGKFMYPFDPKEINHHFTEANANQYLFGAQHVLPLYGKLFKEHHKYVNPHSSDSEEYILKQRLDSIFYTSSVLTGRQQSDVTGLIGQYAHGNEPSHHMSLLYHYTNAPANTQEIIKQIQSEFYKNTPDGLCGNEDCGQMSAWYVFSALGFYPTCPGSPTYQLAHPLFKHITLRAPSCNLEIFANPQSTEHLSGIQIDNKYDSKELQHADLMQAKQLQFVYGKQQTFNIANTIQVASDYIALPFVSEGNNLFEDSTIVSLDMLFPEGNTIYYQIHVDSAFNVYTNPFTINRETTIGFYSSNKIKKSAIEYSAFTKKKKGVTLHLLTDPAPQYSGQGKENLYDGQLGSDHYSDGLWQGFRGEDVIFEIRFDSIRQIDSLTLHCLTDQASWIFLPEFVQWSYSMNGKDYQTLNSVSVSFPEKSEQRSRIPFTLAYKLKTQFLKCLIKSKDTIPDWHVGSGEKAWIFLDEVIIK